MFRVALIAFALAIVVAPSTNAQNAALTEFYGRGVHAYYSGDYAAANDYLSKAIDGGLKDPRAYYFRGLTSVASGKESAADSDYRAGAEMEAAGSFASVGASLTRIQGSNRMAIEDMRQQARLEYQTAAATRSKARYNDIDAAAGDVLRTPPTARRNPPTPPTGRVAPPAIPPAADNPFANDSAAGEPTIESKDSLEGTMADPFADDAAPVTPDKAPAAVGEDPFGGGAAPAPGSDPFGGGAAPAPGSDPFGGDAAPAPATGDDPFGAN